jgi:hypothetical protein
MGDDRRQPHLQAFDVSSKASDAPGCQAGYDATLLLAASAVLDAQSATQVKDHGDSRVRDYRKVDQVPASIVKPGHGNPRQGSGARRDRNIPDSRTGTN